MLIRILISIGIAAVIFLLFWLLKGVMLTPVRKGKNQSLALILHVFGPSPQLEDTVDGLLWLIQNDTLPGELIIEDDGMDEETRRTAELICRNRSVRMRRRT